MKVTSKRTSILVMTIALFAINVVAQGPPHHRGEDRGDRMIEHMDSILDLSDEQKIKLESLHKEFRDEIRTKRQSFEDMDRKKMMELRKSHEAKVKEILTPEQQEIMADLKDERKQNLKKMKAEMKTYKEENIKPTMNRIHEEMRSKLSEEEISTLQTAAVQAKQMRQDFIELNQDSTNISLESNSKPRKREKGRKGKLTKEQREQISLYLSNELSPILEEHGEEADKVLEDLKPVKDTWEADLKAIKQKYDVGEKHRKHKRRARSMKRREKGKKDVSAEKLDKKKEMVQIKFLLDTVREEKSRDKD